MYISSILNVSNIIASFKDIANWMPNTLFCQFFVKKMLEPDFTGFKSKCQQDRGQNHFLVLSSFWGPSRFIGSWSPVYQAAMVCWVFLTHIPLSLTSLLLSQEPLGLYRAYPDNPRWSSHIKILFKAPFDQ